jgi:hypothetical protein
MNKQEILVQLPTEPAYWGSTATPDDVDRIIDRLRDMILMEFGERFDLSFMRMAQPEGSGVHCIHDGSAQEVWEWIGNNWTAAL